MGCLVGEKRDVGVACRNKAVPQTKGSVSYTRPCSIFLQPQRADESKSDSSGQSACAAAIPPSRRLYSQQPPIVGWAPRAERKKREDPVKHAFSRMRRNPSRWPLLRSVRLREKQAEPSSLDVMTSDASLPALRQMREANSAHETSRSRGATRSVNRF